MLDRVAQNGQVCVTIESKGMPLIGLMLADAARAGAITNMVLWALEIAGLTLFARPATMAFAGVAHGIRAAILALQFAFVTLHATPVCLTLALLAVLLCHTVDAHKSTDMAEAALP